MSVWRRTGLEMLPEYRQLIEKADSPMALWIELRCRFVLDYKDLGDDLIGRFYKYAKWCLAAPRQSDAASDPCTAAFVVFYEHLTEEEIRDDVHRWLSKEEFLQLEDAFRYFLDQRGYEEFKERFLEKRAQFLQIIPKRQ